MTNKEKYADELDKMLGLDIAVVNDRLLFCKDTHCSECLFYHSCMTDIEHLKAFQKWLNSEYIEPPKIDWSKIPIDTRIELSNDKRHWWRRYFAEYSTSNNMPTAFTFGTTSWSNNPNHTTEGIFAPKVKYIRFPDGEVEGIVELD